MLFNKQKKTLKKKPLNWYRMENKLRRKKEEEAKTGEREPVKGLLKAQSRIFTLLLGMTDALPFPKGMIYYICLAW